MRRFDLDDLGPADWQTLDAVEAQPWDPAGAPWPAETGVLKRLVVWAGWGLFLAEVGARPDDEDDASMPRRVNTHW